MTYKASRSVTSFAALADGQKHFDWLDGPDHAGREAVPVSHLAPQESAPVSMTKGTCGPSSTVSSPPAILQSFSESKSPGPKSSDVLKKVRICRTCKIEKPYSEFYVNSKGNRRWGCKDCDRAAERTRKRARPNKVASDYKRWRDEKRGHALVNVAKNRAKAKGLKFDLSPANIQARIDNGICELSGIKFDLSTPRAWNAPSLDRIDSMRGYTQDNTRVVLYALNVAVNTWGENRILEIASAIMGKRREASNNLSIAIGERLKKNLADRSSKEFDLTWSRQATPLGHVYYRLAASARRTSAKESGGLPTPAARDGKDVSRTSAHLAARQRHQPSAATRLRAAGIDWWKISTAYCLLMGFPLRWNAAASKATAMP